MRMASLSQCTEDIIIIPYIITPTALKTRVITSMWMPWHAPPTQTQLPDQEHSFMAAALNGSDAPSPTSGISRPCYGLYLDCCSVWEGDSFQVASTSHVSSAQGFPSRASVLFISPVGPSYVAAHTRLSESSVFTGIWIIAPRAQSHWCWMVIHRSHDTHIHHIWYLQLEYCFEPKQHIQTKSQSHLKGQLWAPLNEMLRECLLLGLI